MALININIDLIDLEDGQRVDTKVMIFGVCVKKKSVLYLSALKG